MKKLLKVLGIILDLLENKNVGCMRVKDFRQLFYIYLLIGTFAKTLHPPSPLSLLYYFYKNNNIFYCILY